MIKLNVPLTFLYYQEKKNGVSIYTKFKYPALLADNTEVQIIATICIK